MKGLAVLLVLAVCAPALVSCTTMQEGPDIVGQVPPQTTSRAEPSKMCRPGFYFCPGEVMGCCPNGWGCASTHCMRPRTQPIGKETVDKQAVDERPTNRRPLDRRCAPGFYFCPGEVAGCCPNGWGCASTHCIRPPRQREL
jgi:hypothetical protein